MESQRISDIFVKEVRVERDHGVKLQEVVNVPGGLAPGPQGDHGQGGGGGDWAEHQVLIRVLLHQIPVQSQTQLIVDVNKTLCLCLQTTAGHR